MSIETFRRLRCHLCKGIEEVRDGERPKVVWHETIIDGWAKFRICSKCVAKTFGDQCINKQSITASARHIKPTTVIEKQIEGKIEEIKRPPIEHLNDKTGEATRLDKK